MDNQRVNKTPTREYLEIAVIAKECLSRLSGENWELIEALFIAKTKDKFESLADTKRFLLNFYARVKFSERLNRKNFS